MNLSDALDKYFKSVQAGIRLLIKNKTEEIIKMSASSKLEDKADLDPATINATPEFKPLNTNQRIDNFNKVKELQAEGISTKKISKVIGICRKTVRSYIIQKSLPPRISSTSTNIASFTKLILARLNT